ncbi:MAG: hypothetical protein ABIG85_02135 [Chloroflexota bacterium]
MIRSLGFVAMLLLASGIAGCAPSLPPGTRTCLGFPLEVCRRQVAELEREGLAHGGVVAYRIICTSGSCTATQGQGTETVVFADGAGREGGFGYAVPVGTPPEATFGALPVTPSCLGVPADWCAENARTGAEMIPDWATIVSITVRCTSTCTTSRGDGETRVLLLDGSEQTQGWNYNGELPPDGP